MILEDLTLLKRQTLCTSSRFQKFTQINPLNFQTPLLNRLPKLIRKTISHNNRLSNHHQVRSQNKIILLIRINHIRKSRFYKIYLFRTKSRPAPHSMDQNKYPDDKIYRWIEPQDKPSFWTFQPIFSSHFLLSFFHNP